MTELVSGVGEGERLGSHGDAIACENLYALRACECAGIEAQSPGEFYVHLDEARGCYGGGVYPGVETLRQSRVGVFETEMDGRAIGA